MRERIKNERRLRDKSFREFDDEQNNNGSFEKNIDDNIFKNRSKSKIRVSDEISHSHSLGNSEEGDKFEDSPFDFQKLKKKNEKNRKETGLGLKRGMT